MSTTQENAARLIKSVHEAQDRQLRVQALQEPNTFIDLAEKQGYHFNPKNLNEDVAKLSEEAIASIWNPGIGPRRHLVRR
jgi:Nif11 domain